MSNANSCPSNVEHSPTFNKFMRAVNQIKPAARGMWSEEEIRDALKEIAELHDTLSYEYKTRKMMSQRHH